MSLRPSHSEPHPADPPRGGSRVQEALAAAWLLGAVAIAATILWLQDGRYGLPTPRPDGLPEVPAGASLPWPADVADLMQPERPTLLHFFNPDCPCSRFNLDHVRSLWSRHGHAVDFILVLECDEPPEADFDIDGLPVPILHDTSGELADLAGVYSTPVAVILDQDHAVSYVGNYTTTRFCVDPAGQTVRRVIEQLLGEAPLDGGPIASREPFGCQLPSDLTVGAL